VKIFPKLNANRRTILLATERRQHKGPYRRSAPVGARPRSCWPLVQTLKGEAIRPPRSTLVTQQRAFNEFRHLYNDERPHEALPDRTPASLYRPSRRAYSGALPPVEYPGHFIVKRVTNAGTIRLRKRLLLIANALKQHPVGLEEIDDGIWSIHFCNVLLGRVDERDYIIRT